MEAPSIYLTGIVLLAPFLIRVRQWAALATTGDAQTGKRDCNAENLSPPETASVDS